MSASFSEITEQVEQPTSKEEAIEDAVMEKAIAEGEKSAPVDRNTIFQCLEYPK